MTSMIHRSLVTMALAAVLGFIALFDAGTAQAQCNPITITNNSGCTLDITFVSNPFATTLVTVPPGGPVVYPLPAGFSAVGYITAKGTTLLFPAVGACSGCLLIPSGTAVCCVSVCRPALCTLVIVPFTPCTTTCQ